MNVELTKGWERVFVWKKRLETAEYREIITAYGEDIPHQVQRIRQNYWIYCCRRVDLNLRCRVTHQSKHLGCRSFVKCCKTCYHLH